MTTEDHLAAAIASLDAAVRTYVDEPGALDYRGLGALSAAVEALSLCQRQLAKARHLQAEARH